MSCYLVRLRKKRKLTDNVKIKLTTTFVVLLILTGCQKPTDYSKETKTTSGSQTPEQNQPDVVVTIAEDELPRGWTTKLIEVYQPATVSIQERLSPSGIWNTQTKTPPEGQKWLILTIEIQAPNVGATIPVKEIKVVDAASAAYPGLSIDLETNGQSFVYFEDSLGLGAFDGREVVYHLRESSQTRWSKPELYFDVKRPLKIALLFAIPATTTDLTFKI